MQLSLLWATMSWVVLAGHANPETSTMSSKLNCPRPDLLSPCECEGNATYISCENVTQPFDLRTVFGRLSAELPKDQLKFGILRIENTTAIESLEFNSTGSAIFDDVVIVSPDYLVKIHEGAFVGTEQQIQFMIIDVKSENKSKPSKWQPNLPSPYNWWGLVSRLKSLEYLEIFARGPLSGGNFLHLPANAFSGFDKLRKVIIFAKGSRVTIDSRALAGCPYLSFVGLAPVDRVPAEFVANLAPPPPTDPLYQWPFLLRLVPSNISESSFDPRAFAGCCSRPVQLDLTKSQFQTLPESVFRPFFDGHPDNLVNVGQTRVDNRTVDNAWWATNDVYKNMVVYFTRDDLEHSPGTRFPIEKLGRVNKYKFDPTADNSNTSTTAPTPTRLPRSRTHQQTDLVDDLFMEFDDGDDILF